MPALNWARLFAHQYKAPLVLLHIEPLVVSQTAVPLVGDLGLSPATSLDMETQLTLDRERQQQLTALAEQLRLEGIDCQTELRNGSITETILSVADEHQVDFIVTGRSHLSNFFDRLAGTAATSVARGAHCPVLIVPVAAEEGAQKPAQLQSIVFTTPLEFDQQDEFSEVVDVASRFGASLRVLHVLAENQPNIADDNDMLSQLQSCYGEQPLPADTVKSRTVTGGIEAYLAGHHPDLLVMTTRERDFLSGLLNPSLTSHLVVRLDVPILVYQIKADL